MPPSAINALRRVNFNWTVALRDVWREPEGDVPEIHQGVRQEFAAELDRLISSATQSSPTGWVITGAGGAGKTHLLGRFRAECFRRKICFVLVDMTDVHDFWDTVLLGYFTSLQESIEPDRTQFRLLIEGLLKPFKGRQEALIKKMAGFSTKDFRIAADQLLGLLNDKLSMPIALHSDVIRAVFAINSKDYGIVNIANAWLQGEEVELEAKQMLGLTRSREKSSSIVRGLSWLMSLGGASVVALDQLDPIVTQLDLEHEALQSTPALAIINKLGAGMSELRDVTQRTLTVVSCVDNTWRRLKKNTLKPFVDRYNEPTVLPPLTSVDIMESLVAERMKQALSESKFKSPYPSWPFKKEWLKKEALDSPREILRKCHAHLKECVRREEVRELPPGWGAASEPDLKPGDHFAALDAKFEALRAAAKVEPILDEEQEDQLFGPLIRSALRCAQKEWTLPESVDAVLDENFTGGATGKPLHARLRLVFHKEKSREEHFCIRAMQKTQARSFAARLRSAITQAGIDKDLKFRRLAIVRQPSYPVGETTGKLVKQFEDFGGARLVPAEEELRTLDALQSLESAPPEGFADWLKARRHASNTKLIRDAVPRFFEVVSVGLEAAGADLAPAPAPPAIASVVVESKNTAPPIQEKKKSPSPANESKPPVVKPTADAIDGLLLGRRLIGENPSNQPTTIPLAALRKHGVVFAGAGSGKTVLLKRLIEGTALLGVPAIVIDCANDLAEIGDPWPSSPSQWRDGDAELARQFFQKTERIVWTPGKDSGNALGLEPLPDLAALASSPEELQEAITMSVEALSPVIATGAKSKIPQKQALLHKAFRFLAENGNCNLQGLTAVLRDFPEQATTGIADERKLAAAMADDLSAQLTINPLLCSSGPVLDPAVLFHGKSGKTRISVISFIGLPTVNAQQQFINQLAMTLFTWIKKNPAPPTMALRGLLVIDEARDFVPSGRSTPCLGSMQRLAAQARKYGLGVILATQNPKDLDNKIVGQCSTQWYGKMNSPTAIDAALELLRSRGAASGDDVGALKTGRFYVSNADYLTPPARLETPMCLSTHAGPMDADLVLEKARACRAQSATKPA